MPTACQIEIRPQPGPQEVFLSTTADIAIYGGAAGGGKTFSLLIEPLRHIDNPNFGAVIFRRTSPQITNEGGLWDEASKIYPLLGATPRRTTLEWIFPSGAGVRFAHMEHENNRFDWQGSQITLLGFDELTHFTRRQFNYMLSRNRSTCGVKPYIRAGCNPDPDSWVRDFIRWWIDEKTGLPIKERSGVLRWLIRRGDNEVWFDSRQDAIDSLESEGDYETRPLSVTFIMSRVQDNQILLKSNPEYMANLKALTYVERMQLLEGNWNVRATAGMIFKREWFDVVPGAPSRARRVRYWDCAATPKTSDNKPDWTAGAKLALFNNTVYIEDIRHAQVAPSALESLIKQAAQLDGKDCEIWIEQEPGSSGKIVIDHYVRNVLQGFNVRGDKVTGAKQERWKPLAAQSERHNVLLCQGAWNEPFLREVEAVPSGANDDQADAAAGAYDKLISGQRVLAW